MAEEFKANPNLVNKQLADRSHAGTSFSPEKRAEQEIQGFADHVQNVYEDLKKYAKTEAQKAFLLSEMQQYQSGYAIKYNAELAAKGRTFSSMITGGSKFPIRRHEKANIAEQNRYEEMKAWDDRAQAAILRELKKMAVEEAGGELEVLKTKIADAERNHEFMIKANAIVRKKLTDDQKIREIMALGTISEKTAREILKPDYMQRVGFPAYALSNDTANIHRMKERLKELEKKEITPTGEIPFTGGVIVDNREEDRVQIIFDQKPAQEVINKLRGEGWRWAPSVGAWSRKRTDMALNSARRILGLEVQAPKSIAPAVPAWTDQGIADFAQGYKDGQKELLENGKPKTDEERFKELKGDFMSYRFNPGSPEAKELVELEKKLQVPQAKIPPKLISLLNRYKKHQSKVNEISKETDAIASTSPYGQAPPIFHRLVDKQLDMIQKNISPLWDEVKGYIIPNSDFKTFWQEINWTLGTLPPDYSEIEKVLKKYGVKIPEPEKKEIPVFGLPQDTKKVIEEFGKPVQAISEKPRVMGAPSRQEIVEKEARSRAEVGKRFKGQQVLTSAISTSHRLSEFEEKPIIPQQPVKSMAEEQAKADDEEERKAKELANQTIAEITIQKLKKQISFEQKRLF